MIHIALTTGEPAGIGPEISQKAAQEFLAQHPDVSIHLVADQSLLGLKSHDRLFFKHCALGETVVPGQLNVLNAPYVLKTLDVAIEGCLNGEYQAMVTAPVQKSVISDSGVKFSGHTEYLAEKCSTDLVVMMLCGKPIFESNLLPDQLRVALTTTHIPLQKVSASITAELIEKTIEIVWQDLKNKFGIQDPRIYVTGLNPHAGESGHMGLEERDVIAPAIERMKQKNYRVSGPFPGDTIFSPDKLKSADVILAMYHDQGLAPFKFATFGEGVNVTLGLPIIRTSVDHGTALSIAGKGQADSSSMLAALNVAYQMVKAKGS
ncbi:4-hydroxythreonine-4-phosphate dehydrogenase PdxA [Polynucleobacter sp. MWH-CaK5]|uniref:4-hydroxythreonine-4-phosphate dehydrogenase PdxA n=1 Tax=Polynucleobacter sp. MWH-CaK5 TaxID=2689107 RepID=UPI001BFE187B|nr:4-hydroxythreonine-4-phosphate dehydrogenase PdxA [Polynucleobacter sp. MWH-CaK5]QWD88724.1 4-hydroxythreonine-4-phosphate dehydrogenase PdxA [Polynucleobacter sp. MWH-CaK5]